MIVQYKISLKSKTGSVRQVQKLKKQNIKPNKVSDLEVVTHFNCSASVVRTGRKHNLGATINK